MTRARWFSILVVCCVTALAEQPRTSGPAVDRGIAPAADVQITFTGLICHVFEPEHAPRAVVVRGTAGMEHRPLLTLLERQIASSEVDLQCSRGECTLDLNDTALRFAGSGRATYERGGSFDRIVPHLSAITNGEMSSIRADVFDEVPSPSSAMTAYLELPSGQLSAVPFAVKATFHPDVEQRGLRQFSNGVFLTGKVSAPVLFVRRAGDERWKRIVFDRSATIEMHLENEPTSGIPDPMHWMLYYELSKTPLTVRPMVHFPSDARQVVPHGGIPGCSESSWP